MPAAAGMRPNYENVQAHYDLSNDFFSATVASRLARGRRRLRALLIDCVEGARTPALPDDRSRERCPWP